jgi:hypothetical protein
MPAQTVDATPSNQGIRQCFPGRSDLFGCPWSKPSRGSVPGDLTLASDLAFVFNARRVRAECCVDPLKPPNLSGKRNYFRVVRQPSRDICFLVVLLLAYQVFGAFAPWKGVRRYPILQIHLSLGAYGSTPRFVVCSPSDGPRLSAPRLRPPTAWTRRLSDPAKVDH